MTKLLREAFNIASERYDSQQDRLAYLMSWFYNRFERFTIQASGFAGGR